MVKHHILAVTLCTINRCKAVMGIGYGKSDDRDTVGLRTGIW